MDIKTFCTFSARFALANLMAAPVKGRKDGVPLISQLMIGQYKGFTFPVVFKGHNSGGKRLRDFLHIGYGDDVFLISDRVKEVFETHALKGWQTYPVEVYDKKGAPVPGYHGFSILGKCGPITYDPATLFHKQYNPKLNFYRGYAFDPATWDGSDFFMPENRWDYILSPKAVKAIRAAKFTNAILVPLAKEECEEDYLKPGQLRPRT